MGLIDRFQNLFRPRPTVAEPATLVTPPPRPSTLMGVFAAESDRRSVVEDCRRMVADDTRASEVIKAMARDAVKGGFELNIEGPRADEARAEADALLVRISFWERIDDWVRLTLRDGDSFLELGANTAGDIVHVSRKPSLEIGRWSDEFDQFYNPVKAFFWTDQMWMNSLTPPANATWFAEWQMIHARGGADEGTRYGRPLFASARKAFKRMSEGELDIAIRRKTRAGMKFVHSLEDASEADILAYQARNKAVLSEPFAAIADFFSNKRTSIQAIQGDAHLSEIEDVLHHIRTWWVASPVPMSLLGYGQDLNRDVLGDQKDQYDGVKEDQSAWVTGQFVKPLIERQWLLKGIWPEGLVWSAEWAAKRVLTATTLKEAADAMLKLKALGLRDETIVRLLSRFIPGFDAEAEIQALGERLADELRRVGNNANTGDGADAS